MLNKLNRSFAPARVRGFSLIEMMIAVVLGLIVVAGAVGVVVAISRSNSENIQSMRINQEMRALASVIGEEIRRARRLHDPIAYVGQGGTTSGAFDLIDTSTAGCLVYGYQDATINDGTVSNADAVNNYQAIYLSNGSVNFAKLTEATTTNGPLGCTTSANTAKGATVNALNSPQLNVTALTFACVTTNGTSVSDVSTSTTALQETCNEIDMTLTAKLTSGDIYESTIVHTYVQQIFIRSGAAKTS